MKVLALKIENRSILTHWIKLAKWVESGPSVTSRCAFMDPWVKTVCNVHTVQVKATAINLEIESHAVLLVGTDGTFTPFKVL